MSPVSRPRLVAVVLLAAVVALVAPVRADAPTPAAASPAHAPPARVPLSVTVGGGVSLGAYQAGFLHYMTEAAKKNASLLDLKLVSGASAGTINALLTVLAACTPSQSQPEDNIFWNTWHDVGFDRLFVRSSGDSAVAALSNRALVDVAERLRRVWDRGMSDRCDVVFAVTATRLAEDRGIASGSLAAPRLQEKFVLRIKGRAGGAPPEIHNYPDPAGAGPRALLALPRDQSTRAGQIAAYDRLQEVMLASAAFPVAFPPVDVRVCTVAPGAALPPGGSSECGDAERPVAFIDGGVYDNTPLRLAYHTARRLRPAGERWVWGERAGGTPPSPMVFALVDKDNAGYPDEPEGHGADGATRSLLSFLGNFAGGFVATTMAREVAALHEEAPGFAPRVISSVRHYPSASGQLANFFGFFDRELRRFDFYLGMFDARRMAEDNLAVLMRGRSALLAPADPRTAESPAFRCLAAAYSEQPAPQDACAAPELHAFRILLQVSLDRLYSRCDHLKDEPVARRTNHPLCKRAMRLRPGEERRLVAGVAGAREASWRERPGESSLSHMMRLLAYYRMPFVDLGLDADHADSAMSKIRHRLGRVVEALSVRQGFGERALISVSGKIALNFLHYAPPFSIIYANLGRGYEVGWSLLTYRFRDSTSLRWNLALEGKGVGSLLDAAEGRGPAALSWGLVAGPELEIHGGSVAQVRLALRGGFQLSSRGFGSDAELARSSSGGHALLVQAVPSVALFERLRLQAAFEHLLPTYATAHPGWDVLFGVGWQFVSPFY